MSHVVVVDFEVDPERADEFLRLVSENARLSVALEAGCSRFDVATTGAPGEVFLYEVYDDRAAFDVHLAATHFLAFDAATAAMVRRKAVRSFTLAASPRKPGGGEDQR